VEHAAFRGSVPLGGQQSGRLAGQAARNQMDVSLLAGLEQAEFGVQRVGVGD
jgi:hypothetical protein